jgi:hypothetical protein
MFALQAQLAQSSPTLWRKYGSGVRVMCTRPLCQIFCRAICRANLTFRTKHFTLQIPPCRRSFVPKADHRQPPQVGVFRYGMIFFNPSRSP